MQLSIDIVQSVIGMGISAFSFAGLMAGLVGEMRQSGKLWGLSFVCIGAASGLLLVNLWLMTLQVQHATP